MVNNNENILNMISKFAPRLASFGKAKCDLCGSLSNVNDGEVSVVTDAATGEKRYFHICYDCLHKRMDVNDVHNLGSDENKERWRLEYKAVKRRRTTLNSYDDLCLNCFITTNDIQAFRFEGDEEAVFDYCRSHKALIQVEECIDRYTNHPYAPCRQAFECTEFHTTVSLVRCDDGDDLKVCKGRGGLLCENCRFRKEEK